MHFNRPISIYMFNVNYIHTVRIRSLLSFNCETIYCMSGSMINNQLNEINSTILYNMKMKT